MITLYFQTSMADRRSHRGKEKSKGKGRRYFSKPQNQEWLDQCNVSIQLKKRKNLLLMNKLSLIFHPSVTVSSLS